MIARIAKSILVNTLRENVSIYIIRMTNLNKLWDFPRELEQDKHQRHIFYKNSASQF